MPPPLREQASRVFSFFGGGGDSVSNRGGSVAVPPSLKLHTERDVYRLGDPVLITIEIPNSSPSSVSSLSQSNNAITSHDNNSNAEYSPLIEKLTFEMKGIENLDTQWFTTLKPLSDSNQRRGEYVFMDCSMTRIVSNQIVSPQATKTYEHYPDSISDWRMETLMENRVEILLSWFIATTMRLLQIWCRRVFSFPIPMDGPMSFSTPHISVQWALRFEFFTTPKNVDWTRFGHPLLMDGRDKCEWVLPITVHAPPLGTPPVHTRNEKPVFLEPLWVRN